MAERLEIEITVDTHGAASNVGKLTSALGGLGQVAVKLAKVGLAGLLAGSVALAGGLAFAVGEAMEAEEVLAQLDARLVSTGGAAGVTREMAIGLADSLSLVTRFSDESILSAENWMLTFTNISDDVFPRATQAALDLATATGSDLVEATNMLSKALNDPITNMSALSRNGIQFTEVQKEMIKTLWEAGDALGAQNIILTEVEKQMGGSALAAGQTFAGQLDILRNSAANLAETIGGGILALMQGPLASALNTINNAITPVRAAFEQFFANVNAGMSPVQALRYAFEGLIPPVFLDLFNEVLDMFRAFEILLQDPEVRRALHELGMQLGIVGSDQMANGLGMVANNFAMMTRLILQSGPLVVSMLDSITAALKAMNELGNLAFDFLGAFGITGKANNIPGYASGGYLPEGQLGIVGENGPEFMVGGRGGNTIIPMGEAGAAMPAVNIYNPVFNIENQETMDDWYRRMGLAGT